MINTALQYGSTEKPVDVEYRIQTNRDWIHANVYLDTTQNGEATISISVDPIKKGKLLSEAKKKLFPSKTRSGSVIVKAYFSTAEGTVVNTEEIAIFQSYSPFLIGVSPKKVVENDGVDLSSSINDNYPNPFNPETQISYSLAKAGNVKLAVYNTAGKKVADLVNGSKSAGSHNVKFSGAQLTSGIYYSVMQVNGKTVGKKKMMLIK